MDFSRYSRKGDGAKSDTCRILLSRIQDSVSFRRRGDGEGRRWRGVGGSQSQFFFGGGYPIFPSPLRGGSPAAGQDKCWPFSMLGRPLFPDTIEEKTRCISNPYATRYPRLRPEFVSSILFA